MSNWVYLISFTYPHEANLVKLNLEAEGLEIWMKDELTVQVNNYLSNAIGGVKLYVKEENYDAARQILLDSGYTKEELPRSNKWLLPLDKMTLKIPLLKSLRFEVRLLIVFAIFFLTVITTVMLLTTPTYYK